MNKLLSILILGILIPSNGGEAQNGSAQDGREILAGAPAAEDYPQADAVYLLDRREFTLHLDGTTSTTVHQTVKILTSNWLTDSIRRSNLEGSFVPLGPVVPITYLDRSQRVTIRQARAIRPDGTVQEVDAAASISDQPRDEGMASRYTDRRRVIDFRPLAAVGNVLDLEYVIEDLQPAIPGHFWDRAVMQREDPILRSQYLLQVPHGTSFQVKFQGLEERDQTPQEWNHGSARSYLWERTQVPSLVLENLMPPHPDVTSWILVSSIPSWDQIARWYTDMVGDKYDWNEEMEAAVRAEVGDQTEPEEIRKRLFHYVQKRVRSPEDVSLRGGAGRSARQIFADGVGDCKDQATLLITLLHLAGQEAFPALLRTRELGELVPDMPALEQFNHAVVAVPRGDGSFIWLDPTSGVCPYGYLPWKDQDCWALVVHNGSGTLVRTPQAPPEANRVERWAHVKLYRNCHLEANATVTFHGDFALANRRWFQDAANPPTTWPLAFLNDVRKICPNARFSEKDWRPPEDVHNLDRPISAHYSFRAEPYLDIHRSGASMSFLPSILDRWTAENVTAEQRTQDLVLKTQVRLSTIEFELPTNYDVYDLPYPVRIDYPFARFEVQYHYENGLLTYQRRVEISQSRIPAEQYPYIKDFFERIELEDRYTAVFLKEISS